MGELIEIVTGLHKKTWRDYFARMNPDKPACMKVAKEYGYDFWDGERKFGYGGYSYIHDRWRPVAEQFIERYSLTAKSRVLDVGCGKCFVLFEIQKLLPGIELVGFDISEYGIKNAHPLYSGSKFVHDAADPYSFSDDEFDFVFSLATLHNLELPGLSNALSEIDRVGKRKFIMVESYRNNREMYNLECWALTAESLFSVKEWIWLFNQTGYTGDYEFIFFE